MLEATIPQLEGVGFQRLVFEDFYDCLAGLINQIINPVDSRLLTIDLLLEAFNHPEGEVVFKSQSHEVAHDYYFNLTALTVSNSVVVYLRLLTSAEIKTNPDYAAFLLHPETGEQMDPESFCNNFVEAVGKEAGVPFVHLFVSHEGRIRPAFADLFSGPHRRMILISGAMHPPCGHPSVAKDRCCPTRENSSCGMMSFAARANSVPRLWTESHTPTDRVQGGWLDYVLKRF